MVTSRWRIPCFDYSVKPMCGHVIIFQVFACTGSKLIHCNTYTTVDNPVYMYTDMFVYTSVPDTEML